MRPEWLIVARFFLLAAETQNGRPKLSHSLKQDDCNNAVRNGYTARLFLLKLAEKHRARGLNSMLFCYRHQRRNRPPSQGCGQCGCAFWLVQGLTRYQVSTVLVSQLEKSTRGSLRCRSADAQILLAVIQPRAIRRVKRCDHKAHRQGSRKVCRNHPAILSHVARHFGQ